MGVEFRLLGDVEIRVDGQALDVGHARQRCVLAALLVDANRYVPVDQILERIWAARPPQRARNTLAGYISRLRPVLAEAGVAVAGLPGGYRLDTDPLLVDLHLFYALIARARNASGDDEAMSILDHALGLWRGPAFHTLDTPWLAEIRARLDAARLAAELDRNDLALAGGAHATLLGELTERVAAFPQDERLTGQLMLALYRSGRQAEALRRYAELRRDLAAELGVDPTPGLQRLYKQILVSDPALAPADTPASVPRELPLALRPFTGRAADLAQLDAHVAAAGEQGTVIAISGTAGVGKTALAVHWAHGLCDRYGDGQLFVNLRGFDPSGETLTAPEAIRRFLDALGVAPKRIPSGVEAQAALYRSLTAGKRMIVVFDNARDADQVLPLLPGAGPGVVLVTSRHRLTGLVTAAGAHQLTLPMLDGDDARALLARGIGARRMQAEPLAAQQIAARCGGLPLALVITSARAAAHPGFPLTAFAGELAAAGSDLDMFDGGDSASDVRTVFSWSYRALDPSTARLFRVLGLHPGPTVSAAAAASLAGAPPAKVRPMLAELARAHLLIEETPGRFGFHDLLRAYAAEQARQHDTEPERLACLRRMLDHYLHTAHRCATLLHPYRDPITLGGPEPGAIAEQPGDYDEALAWFAGERGVLLSCAAMAGRLGLHTHAWQLAWTMWTFLDLQGHWSDQVDIGQTGLAAAREAGEPTWQAIARRILASATVQLGRHADAHHHLREALDLYHRTGDHAGQAHAHNNIATVWERQGRFEEALDHARQSFELYRSIDYTRGQAQGLNSIGWYHARLGNHHQAVDHCSRALAALEKLGDRMGVAMTLDSLGYAYGGMGRHPQAIRCYRRAIEEYAHLDAHYERAATLARLGDTHELAGQHDAARAARHSALSIFDRLRHPDAEAIRSKLSGTGARA